MAHKILFDTDIGSDIDDAVCLAYLLAHPECDLVGITTVSGEPVKRAMMASAMCKIAGKDVPIYPGSENPLLIAQRQPKAQQASALPNWAHDTTFDQAETINFMRHTIRANPGEITLLSVGPLTNIALLFAVDPEIPALLKDYMMMGGVFNQPDALEWNALLDPHATAMVFKAPTKRIQAVGLDVTTKVVMDAPQVRERFQHPLLRPVLDFAEVWFKERSSITFHDPLAAVCLFDDDVCTFEKGIIRVELQAPDLMGQTIFTAGDGSRHEIATQVDSSRFFERYFSVF